MVANQAHHQLEARQGPCDYWGDDSDQCKGFKAYTSSTGNVVQQSSTATAATATTTASGDDGSSDTDATSITTSLALGETTATLSGTGISDGKATATNTVVSSDYSSNSIATTSPSTLETSITSNSDATSTGPQTIVGGGLGSDLAGSTATPSPTASGLSLQQKESDSGLSSGAVAAAIVVPLLFALLAMILAVLCIRHRRRRRNHLDSAPTSHTHFLAPMREKFSRSSPRNSLPPTASLKTGPPILTSPHNNTYNTGLDTPGTSHRGQSDEYYAPPRRSEGGTFIDPPPPYKPSSLTSSTRSAARNSPSHPQPPHPDGDLLVPPPPTAATASHATTPYEDYFHHRRSLGPFTDLAATTTPLADEQDSRPSTAATASTFRAHPLSSAASGSARSDTSSNPTAAGHPPPMMAGLSPYDIHPRHGYGQGTTIPVGRGGGIDTRSTTPRSFSSEMYSDTASVHSARAGLVRDGGPRVLGSSGSRRRDGGRGGREGDPFGDEGAETEGEEWHSLTGGRGRSGDGSGSGSGRGLGSFEWEEASR
ncbi:hypothetical protein KC357_g4187 [Hortaea werneckii]|nr:hypothetical protein KC357_g4187 [Hortaea werneckii]